jgi:transcriptional regulator with GAF, ATPase, and Fis domain
MVWLRLLADHAATAIVNARAFAEIERLKARLEVENEYLREEVMEAQRFRDLVGKSPAIRNVQRQIELVAPTDASVLILGESGVGKEVVARAIHRRSERRNKPMVRVNCASIPRELYESEFFGHMKGAFTGALRNRAGRFEAAHEGTLFLDEVGEIPLELQSKLLRVLQEGQYERVGDEKTRQVDVRVIAATNRDLKREVEQGRFRQDLYYRLNVFPIEIPPLRQREQDIPVLAKYLLPAASRRLNRPVPHLTQAHIMKLQNYHLPGNFRELQNFIERAIITMGPAGLHFDIPEHSAEARARSVPHRDGAGSSNEVVPEHEMKRREKDNVLAALEQSDWKLYGTGGAAALLGIKPTTLASRMKRFRIEKRR